MLLRIKASSYIISATVLALIGFLVLLLTAPLASATVSSPRRPVNLEEIPHLTTDKTTQPYSPAANAPQVSTWYRLTFQSYRDNNWEIYSGNDDGSGQTRLTASSALDIQPRFNHGATRIAFASRRTGNYEIYVMNADGSGVTRLTNTSADDVSPYWSPDGSRIVFQSYRDGQAEVYVMNANGSGQTRLTNNSGYDGEPSWSPDGTQIAFVSKRTSGDTDYWLWLMNANGTNQHLLAALPYVSHPVWSPSGTKLALDVAGGDYWQNLWVINADGSNAHAVFDEGGYADAWAGSWSPDERYIAFTRIYYVYSGGQLYWTNAYLDAVDTVTPGLIRLSYSGVDWRPDWQSIDSAMPTSSVSPLPTTSPSPIFVSWSGSDIGSGLANYDVQVKDGSAGTWVDWQTATTSTSGNYPGVGGHTYYFRSRAHDISGNLEAWPTTQDASTTIETLPPVSSISALPAFAKGQVEVSWVGGDPGESGIQSYDVQYRDGLTGTWTDWLTNIASSTATFSGTDGHTYFFRTRALDKAQNLENWPTGDGDASIQFYVWAITGAATDNTGTPIAGLNITSTLDTQATIGSLSDPAGLYASHAMSSSLLYTTTWSKSGYGNLPSTAFVGGNTQEPSPTQGVLPAQNNGGPAIVSIANLIPGQRYRIVIKGTFDYTYGIPADAQWAWSAPGCFCQHSPNISFNGALLTAQNGQTEVDPSHTYVFVWTADIAQLWLNINDSGYGDNSGQLSFTITPDTSDAQLDAILPPQNNAIANGDFEAVDFDPWMTNGELTPTLTSAVRHTGHNSVFFGTSGISNTGDSILSQAVAVPTEHPALSYLYLSKNTQSTLLSDLAAYWSLDEPSGARQDATGHGNNLQAHNGVGVMPGKIGEAAVFSPTLQSYLSHLDNADLSTGDVDFTIAGWAYLNSLQNPGSIVGKGNTSAYNTLEYSLGYNSGVGRFAGVLGNYSTGIYDEASGFGSPAPGQWYFLVFWHNATQRQVGISVNGAENVIQYQGGGWDTPYEFRMGSDLTNQSWNGAIDEIGLWKRVLTADERAALYNNGQGCAYPFLVCATPTEPPALAPQSNPSFAVEVSDGVTTTTLHTEVIATQDWTHRWFDLSAWAGQTVTVTFKVDQGDTDAARGAIYLDDVSLGSANADVWTTIKTPATSPRGTQVTYEVTYGNRGGAPSDGTFITATLPADLIDIQASLPPLTNTSSLVWDVGSLPAKSDSYTLLITATVAPTATSFSTLISQVVIEPTGTELEKFNNSAMTESYIGWRTYLPVIRR
ncbi:MAG: hypothetical protein U0559_06145 [Anaerolineae bacterium]